MEPYFLNNLSVTLVDCVANSGRGKWQLNTSLSFFSVVAYNYYLDQGHTKEEANQNAFIKVPYGFETDFMTVPPEVPGAVSLMRPKRAGAVHDYLYTAPHQIPDRELCDQILREMIIADLTEFGADEALAFIEADGMFAVVRTLGSAYWD
jgi:Protein of unknown function (DUF1353)